ncbi:dephospho-CoA kinase [bacterium 1XD21-13]|nr:dephospho-CoA kinase [bacterium 1XD21-13]
MRVIGITGGVGAGKSRILDFLEKEYEAKVFQADEAGHRVMEPGTGAFAEITRLFGREILGEDGRIDRRALGALVFSDQEKRECLNGIIHPAVKAMALEEIARTRHEGVHPLFVIEAALLIEDHYERICDELWYVYADERVRRERLRTSRGYSDEKITAVFESQLSEAEFRRHCQLVIDNSGSIEAACEQIRELLHESSAFHGLTSRIK